MTQRHVTMSFDRFRQQGQDLKGLLQKKNTLCDRVINESYFSCIFCVCLQSQCTESSAACSNRNGIDRPRGWVPANVGPFARKGIPGLVNAEA